MSTSSLALILFICTGNTARSYMAEAMTKKIFHHQAYSRGLEVKAHEPEAKAVLALAEWGIEMPHLAQNLTRNFFDNHHPRLILTMTLAQKQSLQSQFPAYRDRVLTLSECARGVVDDINDPFGLDLKAYQMVRDKIYKDLERLSINAWTCTSFRKLTIIDLFRERWPKN